MHNVLLKPILSEKSTEQRDTSNKYSFFVVRQASKDQIKSTIETLYKVNVLKVNTLLLRGKLKRKGVHLTLGQTRKKAVVTVAAGQKIGIFEDL